QPEIEERLFHGVVPDADLHDLARLVCRRHLAAKLLALLDPHSTCFTVGQRFLCMSQMLSSLPTRTWTPRIVAKVWIAMLPRMLLQNVTLDAPCGVRRSIPIQSNGLRPMEPPPYPHRAMFSGPLYTPARSNRSMISSWWTWPGTK